MKTIMQIPCYNEAETLHRVVSDLPSAIAGVDVIEPVVSGRADIAVGDRRPGEDVKFSPLKRFLQRLGRRVFSRLAGRDLPDPVSGFRAYSRFAAQRTHIVTG